jgi:hypothetical protein
MAAVKHVGARLSKVRELSRRAKYRTRERRGCDE